MYGGAVQSRNYPCPINPTQLSKCGNYIKLISFCKFLYIIKINKLLVINSMNTQKKIVWIYSPWKGNFWFIDLEDEKKWYFCFWFNNMNAMPWDKVEAKIKVFKWREEAVVTKIIERRKLPIVGKISLAKTFWFVIPNNRDFKNDIFISGKYLKWVKDWDIVSVEILKWTWKKPEWKILKVLWKEWDKWVDILAIAAEYGARIDFPRIINKELDQLPKKVKDKDFKNRKDLRKLFTITIDWADSKDLDDAISVEKLDNWKYKLYVHIADVAHYVKEWWILDKEAKRRWNSIYLVDRVIPMLPEKLSNDLCSLNPNTDKLTLTCEIDINKAWHIVKTNVYESVINTNFRMTYKEVDQIINNKLKQWDDLLFFWKVSNELIDMLNNSEWLRKILANYKKSLWVLDFDFPETKIIVDENWNPIEFKKYERYNSNKIIEEFMILANEAISRKFSDIPFLYRIHEQPSDEDIAKLKTSLALFNINLDSNEVSPMDISRILLEIKNTAKEKLLSKMILRSLSKAVYSSEAEWHFWLALEYYSHFTSPIRRYPDLQIHRIIKEKINWKFSKLRKTHYEFILEKVARKCSDTEQKAEKLEYKIKDLMAVKYMKDKIWEKFESTVSWMIPAWIFVELENTIEWFVEIDKNNFVLNEELMEIKNNSTAEKFSIWDKVNVELKSIDEQLLRLEFILI